MLLICDINEKLTQRRVTKHRQQDNCNTTRFACEMLHVKSVRYPKAAYVFDTALVLAFNSNRRRTWNEFRSVIKEG
jgi:hypothetical protein